MPEDLYKICYSRYFLILLEDVISTSFSQRKHLAEYFHAYITSSVLLYSCTLHIPVRENDIVRCSQTYIHAYIVHAHSTVHAWSQTFLAPWCMHAFYMGNALCMQYVCELSHTQRGRERSAAAVQLMLSVHPENSRQLKPHPLFIGTACMSLKLRFYSSLLYDTWGTCELFSCQLF